MGGDATLALDVAEELRIVAAEVLVLETVALCGFDLVEAVDVELTDKTAEVAVFEVPWEYRFGKYNRIIY